MPQTNPHRIYAQQHATGARTWSEHRSQGGQAYVRDRTSPLGMDAETLLATALDALNHGVELAQDADKLREWEGVRLVIEEIGAYLEDNQL